MGRKSTGSKFWHNWKVHGFQGVGPNGPESHGFQAHGPNVPEVHRFQSFSISRFTGHTRMLGPSVFPDSEVLRMLGPLMPKSIISDTQHKRYKFRYSKYKFRHPKYKFRTQNKRYKFRHRKYKFKHPKYKFRHPRYSQISEV